MSLVPPWFMESAACPLTLMVDDDARDSIDVVIGYVPLVEASK